MIRAHFKADDAIHRIAACRQHQDRTVGAGADLPTDFEAVDIRQHEIKNDDIHRLAFMQCQPSRSILGVNDVTLFSRTANAVVGSDFTRQNSLWN